MKFRSCLRSVVALTLVVRRNGAHDNCSDLKPAGALERSTIASRWSEGRPPSTGCAITW